MMNKIKSILITGKKKAAFITMCGALALTLGTGAAFAANSAKIGEKSLVKNENGVRTYSTDDGKTWNQGVPEGFQENINKDGNVTSTVGIPPKDGASLMVQDKNGAISYSTDGGKTWSENAPEGVASTVNEDGSVSVMSEAK